MGVEHDFEEVTPDELSHSILKQIPTKTEPTISEDGGEHRLYYLGRSIYAHTLTPQGKDQSEEEIIEIGKASATVPWPGVDKIREKYQELYSEVESVKAADGINWDEVSQLKPTLEIYCTDLPSRLDQIYFNGQELYVNAEKLGVFGDELEKGTAGGETKKAIWKAICELVDTEQPKHLNSPHLPIKFGFDTIFEWELRAGLLIELGVFKNAGETAKTVALRERGLKQTEIAELLDIDQSTVSKNLTRAKDTLARARWTLDNQPEVM